MSWAEIQRKQLENNLSICGIYSKKQLENWGTQLPVHACSKMAATIALIFSISLPATGLTQSHELKDSAKSAWVQGVVRTNLGFLSNVKIYVPGTPIEILSDSLGRFILDLANYKDSLIDPSLIFECIGYSPVECMLGTVHYGINREIDIEMKRQDLSAIYFSAKKPTLKKRIQRKLRSWFGQ
jgi:hypothetical protein